MIEEYNKISKKIDNKKVILLLKDLMIKNDLSSFKYIFNNSDIRTSKYFKKLLSYSIKNKLYNFSEYLIQQNNYIDETFYKYIKNEEYKIILLYTIYNKDKKYKEILEKLLLKDLDPEGDFCNKNFVRMFIDMFEKYVELKIYFENIKKEDINRYNKIFENKNYQQLITEKNINNF